VLHSTIGRIVTHLSAALASERRPVAINTAPLRSDEPAPRGAELAGKVAALLGGKLGGAVVETAPTSLAEAEARARRGISLVYLQTEIAAGQLRVTADVYRTTDNVWERVREPVPTPTTHAYAAGRVDGEVRSYLAPVPLVGARIDRATLDDKEIVALACGDLDDDGAIEIIALSRRRLAIGRARAGRFVIDRSVALRDLSGIAPAPMREPLGGVTIVPGRGAPYLDVGITDRARASRLDGELRLLGAIQGIPFATPTGDACLRFQGSTATSFIAKCAENDVVSLPVEVEGPFDAIASAMFVTREGVPRTAFAGRDPRTGEVALRTDDRAAILGRAGAQLAIADLDQDGAPEVISTLDVLVKPQGSADDALVVTTWEHDGTLREKSRTPVPPGVRAVAACPPDGRGPAPVVVATTGELWIVR
jgi:hypothetical protein